MKFVNFWDNIKAHHLSVLIDLLFQTPVPVPTKHVSSLKKTIFAINTRGID